MQNINEKELDELVLIIQKQVKQLENSQGWEVIADGKVKGFKKKSLTNSLITRAQTHIGVPMEKIVDFLMKDESILKINDMMLFNNVIYEKKGKYKILHAQAKTPFPLDNRETVTMTTWSDEGNKFYLGFKSCNFPKQPSPKCVMAHVHIGGWVLERIDNKLTKVINFADMDPKGNIPDFLKNTVAQKRIQGLKDLEGVLRKQGY